MPGKFIIFMLLGLVLVRRTLLLHTRIRGAILLTTQPHDHPAPRNAPSQRQGVNHGVCFAYITLEPRAV